MSPMRRLSGRTPLVQVRAMEIYLAFRPSRMQVADLFRVIRRDEPRMNRFNVFKCWKDGDVFSFVGPVFDTEVNGERFPVLDPRFVKGARFYQGIARK